MKIPSLSKTAFSLALGGLLLTAGCASKQEKQLQEKLGAETAVKSNADLRAEADKLLTAPGLTEQQRKQLTDLRADTYNKTSKLHQESLRLRSVLIKDLAAPNYNEREVELIKKKIKKNENERLSVMFDAITAANQILGHHPDAQKIMEDYWFDHPVEKQMQ